jgi:hypothetical protein
MPKLNVLFEQFLTNIEPDKEAVEHAQEAHKPVRHFLEHDEVFGKYVADTFLYGSYRRHTAVGDIKDVDIVLLTNFDPSDEKNTPQSVLRRLKSALAQYYDDPENPEYQRRSIRINDPLPKRQDVVMTLDVIPAVAVNGDDQPLLVPDREVKAWIQSHPRGHIEAISNLNRDEYSHGRFVPLVKIMKAWWKHQCQERQPEVERPNPKGFWIECLTAKMFDPKHTGWADHFITVLANVDRQFGDFTEVPQLQDPGIPSQTIQTSMTNDEFDFFMKATKECLSQATTARNTTDPVESSTLWRSIFGDKFPLYESDESDKDNCSDTELTMGVMPQVERLRWPIRLTKKYKVRIDAYIYWNDICKGGLNSDSRTLPSGLKIQFNAHTNVRGAYQVFWQVVNTGNHAKQENGLRGQLFQSQNKSTTPSTNPLMNWENTQYTGKHWIQCFIVKNEYCIAQSDKFYVKIRNRDYPG